jgi:hypothetical protein
LGNIEQCISSDYEEVFLEKFIFNFCSGLVCDGNPCSILVDDGCVIAGGVT